ncbi:phosphoglycerate dehydrogenase [Tistrella bauzanensis]|jgi:D-3-phosphoglycerate dehydrogenase|uniref:D-3-phosphoglycerate dehydrogenase n=1 Tax=Tistrella arctica TaxID=3133430 RepID=A0ABU9YIQ9_9PROT
MPKVLISDKMSPAAAEIFSSRGVEVDVKPGMTPDELRAIIGQYDGLAIRSATKVTKDILAAATNLRVVGRAGIGVDNVDIPAASSHGVVVMNTPFGNSITTAEHAISLMLSMLREIPAANASTHAGKWEKNRFMGVEVTGKTLGVIGVGNIGAIVADRAQGLKMKVIGFDPFLSPERAQDLGVEKVELDELFRRADVITLHTPLTDGTRGVINAEAIGKMKTGVYIVNCARGGLVVEKDLKAALDAGKVAGAALDVFSEEPARQNPLFGDERVVATPHLGASTVEAQENVALQVAEQMADYLLTGAITNAINVPSVTAEEAPRLKPYMKLAEQLGSFSGQLVESGIRGVTIEYSGQVATLNTRPITAALLTGLLRPLLDSVNMVNAPIVAKERNISVTEVRSDKATDFQTQIKLTISDERGGRSVAGTLIAGSKPRLVSIEDVAIEAELAPNMLFVVNDDKPGFIGAVGRALGEAGINIASFHLGRQSPGARAICLIEVDQPLREAVLKQVQGLPNVVTALSLTF